MERRFIEDSFPIKEVSLASTYEKRIRDRHISSIHTWWARRPMASSRSVNFAALVDTKKIRSTDNVGDFIINLAKWENSSNKKFLNKARDLILLSNNGKVPKILDPFAGGGSIPLEAIKIGCDTFASDYNPVSTLILKCSTEYPIKFNQQNNGLSSKSNVKLLDIFRKWNKWVFEKTYNDIGDFFSSSFTNSVNMGYVWCHVVPCQNPKCNAAIPLLNQFWLAKSNNRKVILFPNVKSKKVEFQIIDSKQSKIPKNFDPNNGNIARAKAKCFVCNSVVDNKTMQKLFVNGKSSEQMLCVFSYKKGKKGKNYNLPTKDDLNQFDQAKKCLANKIKKLKTDWSLSPVPDELISRVPITFGIINVWIYGMKSWGDLFNARQQLMLLTFIEKIRDAYLEIKKENSEEYAKIICTYLAFGVDYLANYGSKLCRLNVTGGRGVANTFGRQSLGMVFEYAETNPFNSEAASWNKISEKIENWIDELSNVPKVNIQINNSSVNSLQFDDNYFDAVLTDPPYYDNVPYSYLSDFFYVWLKRSIGYLYPDLFSTPLTPKSNEIVAYADRQEIGDAKKYFEHMMDKALKEISRVLKQNGVAVIVYAHKSTEGWETLINSLLSSGLVVTAAWPIHTEMKNRIRSQESAVLASSIYMVCRKWKKEPIGFYRDVKKELKEYLNKKLEQLWNEGISGADFFISAIGSAIQVFGKYEKVVDDSDNQIYVSRLLNDTREIVTNFAIYQVIHGEFSDKISQMTRFYILWRWAFGEAKVPFDGALKMAQSVGMDIEHEWGKGFIVKEKEIVRVLGPDERTEKELSDPHDLIDILHNALLLWKKEKRETVEKFLEEKGYKNSEVFKRVAQAISESLPASSTEKKLLDGFLTGFKSDDSQRGVQSKLYD